MGDSENLDALIAVVKVKINEIIPKPKMTDKLLTKPPFRFLHDTITAVCSVTGFAEGLYSGEELDSAALTEKQAKLAYLEKIFMLVGICKGKVLPVKAARVVSGLEPEHTNAFLIDLAECASDPMYDSVEAVSRTLAGEQPGDRSPPIRKNNAFPSESKHDSSSSNMAVADSKRSSEAADHFGGESKSGGAKGMPPAEMDMPQQLAPERGKSRGGTRGGKPNQATADTGLGGGFSAAEAPRLDSEIERCDGSEAATQQLLGELIQKPKLTEKLLGKPPFRFLHDIVAEVMRATGFATGLYSPAELDSAAMADKASKMGFLEKIIRLVGVQLNTLVEAKPAKIVAGLDAPATNNFLQLLAVAAKHMPDSSAAVRTVLEQLGEGGDRDDSGQQQQQQRPAEARHDSKGGSEQDDERRQESRQTAAAAPLRQSVAAEPKEVPQAEERREFVGSDATDALFDNGGREVKRSSRPVSAQRRPPKIKEAARESKVLPPAAKKTEGIIIDGADDDEEDDIPEDTTRLADEVRSEAKGVSGGGGAGPAESKLVKDILSRQAEQEAASAKKTESAAAAESKSPSAADQANQGAGVRLGVRLGRNKASADKNKIGAAGGPGAAGATVSLGEGDLAKMRGSIQTLVQHTGPLGTCMDFIQEDISLMTGELHRWEEECRKYEAEYEEAKRRTKEALHPLRVELMDVEDQIMEQMARISSKKAAVARNDDQIHQILKIIATA